MVVVIINFNDGTKVSLGEKTVAEVVALSKLLVADPNFNSVTFCNVEVEEEAA